MAVRLHRWRAPNGVRDEAVYLVTAPDLTRNGSAPSSWCVDRNPYYLEANIPGLFAAGDVRHRSVKRCASAVGEGAMAVMFVQSYLASD
jgi:thioredoxin reductase (NADPH)